MMEKLILLRPQEQKMEETFIDTALGQVVEEVIKLRKSGIDTSSLFLALGKLLILMGNTQCHVEQYIGRGERHG